MHFLLDANMPRSAAAVIQAAGHGCMHIRDTPLGDSSDVAIGTHARSNGLVLITRDFDFADIRAYPPDQYPGIVVLTVPETATAATIARLVESFLAESECLAHLRGRLAIVEFGRVRLRPKPNEPKARS